MSFFGGFLVGVCGRGGEGGKDPVTVGGRLAGWGGWSLRFASSGGGGGNAAPCAGMKPGPGQGAAFGFGSDVGASMKLCGG